jgi:hypothetical protein
MNRYKILFTAIALSLIYLSGSWCFADTAENVQVDITALDPAAQSTLGSDEMLYVLIKYESAIPLRFQAVAMLQGEPLEVGAIRNPEVLHAPGRGEAMVWVGYTNPTHIDAVRITVLNEEWRKLFQLSKEADVTWLEGPAVTPRQPAGWVDSLIKAERRKSDLVYDPEPEKFGLLYDLLFFLTIASIPLYIFLQLHMLWRYKYRWRELAVIPIFPYLIVAFFAVAGLEIDTSLQVTFLFRYTPFALLYLGCLWIAKRFWQNKLPPPKLYKPPKA